MPYLLAIFIALGIASAASPMVLESDTLKKPATATIPLGEPQDLLLLVPSPKTGEQKILISKSQIANGIAAPHNQLEEGGTITPNTSGFSVVRLPVPPAEQPIETLYLIWSSVEENEPAKKLGAISVRHRDPTLTPEAPPNPGTSATVSLDIPNASEIVELLNTIGFNAKATPADSAHGEWPGFFILTSKLQPEPSPKQAIWWINPDAPIGVHLSDDSNLITSPTPPNPDLSSHRQLISILLQPNPSK